VLDFNIFVGECDMGMRFLGLLILLVVFQFGQPTAAMAQENAVYVLEEEQPREVGKIAGYEIICSPELSPDQKWIAVDGWKSGQSNTDAHLLLLNVETKETKDLGIGCMPSWSSSGEYITYSRYGQGVWVRSVDGKEEHQIDGDGWGAQWSPDGTSIAYSVGGQLVIFDGETETSRNVFPIKNGQPGSPYTYIYWNCTWSPDSKSVCMKAQRKDWRREFAVVTVARDDSEDDTGEEPKIQVCCDAADYNEDIAWRPDGKSIVIPRGAKDNAPARLDWFRIDAPTKLEPVPGQPQNRHNSGMCWSRDGKRLYYISAGPIR
jgi:TolB protein